MRLYLNGLKKIGGNGTFEDEVVLEGEDYLGHRLTGFFHKNYIFKGALEVDVSEEQLLRAIRYSNNLEIGITVEPCGGGFIGRGRKIQVGIEKLCYNEDNRSFRGLTGLKIPRNNPKNAETLKAKAYLKCKYGEGGPSMPREYTVVFKCADSEVDGCCIVNRKEVIPLEGGNGLVRVHRFKKHNNGKSALILLKDDGEMMLSPYQVPLGEIVTK